MKKWCALLAALSITSFAHASGVERMEQISSKVTLQNKNGYFVLADGSCWKVISFVPRWRTPSEWWNNVQIVPDQYKCYPADWMVGTVVQAAPKFGSLEVNESDASNQEELAQCTHLLFNTRTGNVLFAIALDPGHCMVEISTDFYREGKEVGIREGRAQQYRNSQEIYREGYQAGYKTGYKDGLLGQPNQENN